MKINNILIVFLLLIAFFIVYLIFFNNDIDTQEKFEVDNTQRDGYGIVEGEGGEEGVEGVEQEIIEESEEEALKKKFILSKSFDELRKDKPMVSILEDPLFNDVITHENDYATRKSGLDQCIETCNGSCVEFGQTSNAHCYPNPTGLIAKTTFYESLRDKTYKTENYDEKMHDLKFPNLR